MSLGAAGPDHMEESVGVIATISYDVATLESVQQKRRSAQIVSLTGGSHQPNRQPIPIDGGVNSGAQSSTRMADGMIFAPFLSAAAYCRARMIEHPHEAASTCGAVGDVA